MVQYDIFDQELPDIKEILIVPSIYGNCCEVFPATDIRQAAMKPLPSVGDDIDCRHKSRYDLIVLAPSSSGARRNDNIHGGWTQLPNL